MNLLRVFVRTTRADARTDWLAPAVVFVVMTLAAVSVVQAVVVRSGAAIAWDRAVIATNSHDVLFVGAPDADFSPVPGLKGVTATDGPYRVAGPFVPPELVEAVGPTVRLRLRLLAADAPPDISRPRFVTGHWPVASDQIAIAHAYARRVGLEHGDRLTLAGATGSPAEFTVVGTAVDTVSCPGGACDPNLGYVTGAGLDRLSPTDEGRLILIQVDDREGIPAMVAAAETALAPGTINEIESAAATRTAVLEESNVTGLSYAGFSIVTLLVAGVATANLVGLGALFRRRQLGLLKAIGITPRQVTLALVGQALLVGTAAFVVGTAVSLVLGRIVLSDLLTGLDTGPLPPVDLLGVGIGFLVVQTVLAAAAYLPARKAAREPVTAAVGRSPRTAKAKTSGLSPRVPVTARIGLRHALGDRRRMLFAVATLVLAFGAAVVALGAFRTIQQTIDRPELLGDPYDVFVNDSAFTLDDATALLGDDERVAVLFTRAGQLVRIGDDPELVVARLLGGDYAAAGYHVPEGRMVAAPGEAVAGYGFLQRFDVDIGDTMTVRVGGGTVDLTLVGRHGESDDDGVVIMFDERSVPFRLPTSVAIQLTDRRHLDDVVAAVRLQVPATGIEVEAPGPGPVVTSLKATFGGLSVILGLVALVALVGSAGLAVGEHRREFGVLKTIGFTPRQVLASVAVGNGLIAALAAVIGLVVGLVSLRVELAFIGIELGTGPDFGSLPSWWVSLLAAVAAVAISVAATLVAGRRAAAISAADVLRYE